MQAKTSLSRFALSNFTVLILKCPLYYRWLQPHFQKYPNLGAAIKSVANFFKVDGVVGSLRMAAVEAQTLKIEV